MKLFRWAAADQIVVDKTKDHRQKHWYWRYPLFQSFEFTDNGYKPTKLRVEYGIDYSNT